MKTRFCLLAVASALVALTTTIQAQAIFTYQGHISDDGSNFTGAGQFKFALVTGTNLSVQATAVATNTSGFITGIGVVNPGHGYTTAPAVTINGGGGSGATGTATISGGEVTAIKVNDAGSGYSSSPTVLIAPPPANIDYTTYWSNDGTGVSGSEPSNAVFVPVSDGSFTVILGDTNQANMMAIPLTLFSAVSNLQLLTWFNDGVDGFAMLTPAQPLTPTPYAISALTAASSATATFAATVAGIAVQSNTNGAPNVITGSPLNFVGTGVVGATISGGGTTNYLGHAATNSVVGVFGTVGGGIDNSAGPSATVAGGEGNSATNVAATVAGGNSNTASGNSATVGGGYQNAATNTASTVAGGQSNAATGDSATIGGGSQNAATNLAATVAGGQGNTAGGRSSTVGGGSANTANAQGATVAGGSGNIASVDLATIGGGSANTAHAEWATVAGGDNNTASGGAATVPGGANNTASGNYAFAAGQYAQAVNYGSFVWSDASSFTSFSSSADNQFAVRAAGGVLFAADLTLAGGYHNFSLTGGNALGYLYGSYPALGDGVHLGYNYYYDATGTGHVANSGGATSRLTVGYGFISLNIGDVNAAPGTQRLYADSTGVTVNGTFNNQSDRSAKQHFAQVSPAQILDKVARLPISEWSYKEDVATRHVGPVAQDFYSIFNIGTDDKHIAPMDEGGVALAAIQGLNQKMNEKDQKLQEQDVQIEKQASELEELRQQVKQLGQIVNTLNQKLGDANK